MLTSCACALAADATICHATPQHALDSVDPNSFRSSLQKPRMADRAQAAVQGDQLFSRAPMREQERQRRDPEILVWHGPIIKTWADIAAREVVDQLRFGGGGPLPLRTKSDIHLNLATHLGRDCADQAMFDELRGEAVVWATTRTMHAYFSSGHPHCGLSYRDLFQQSLHSLKRHCKQTLSECAISFFKSPRSCTMM